MRGWLFFASIFGLTGVLLGALGAHALNEHLTQSDRLAAWQTAVQYQMWHALALLAIALLSAEQVGSNRMLRIAGGLFVIGILLFSGSIYALAAGGPKLLGPITPLGGLCLLAGWVSLLLIALRRQPSGE